MTRQFTGNWSVIFTLLYTFDKTLYKEHHILHYIYLSLFVDLLKIGFTRVFWMFSGILRRGQWNSSDINVLQLWLPWWRGRNYSNVKIRKPKISGKWRVVAFFYWQWSFWRWHYHQTGKYFCFEQMHAKYKHRLAVNGLTHRECYA